MEIEHLLQRQLGRCADDSGDDCAVILKQNVRIKSLKKGELKRLIKVEMKR
jgi:hypothetical protein